MKSYVKLYIQTTMEPVKKFYLKLFNIIYSLMNECCYMFFFFPSLYVNTMSSAAYQGDSFLLYSLLPPIVVLQLTLQENNSCQIPSHFYFYKLNVLFWNILLCTVQSIYTRIYCFCLLKIHMLIWRCILQVIKMSRL